MNLELIDIGANLTNKRFSRDLDAVIYRAKAANVAHIVVTGTSMPVSERAAKLTRDYPEYLSSTAGVHPHDAKSWVSKSQAELLELLNQSKVVAVGECGLDYNRNFSPKDSQLRCFEDQLAIAADKQLPVFLHERDAHDDFFRLLGKYRDKLSGAVVHCFTGGINEVSAYLDLDCHIGITGWLSDNRRATALRQAIPAIPLHKLMIETDAPFLTPKDTSGKPVSNRCEPCHLQRVLSSLVEYANVSEAELAKHLYKNTRDFFGLAP